MIEIHLSLKCDKIYITTIIIKCFFLFPIYVDGAWFGHGWYTKLKFLAFRTLNCLGHKSEILVAWLRHGFRFMRVVRMWGCIYVMRLNFSDYKMILVTIQGVMHRIRSCPNHALCPNLSCPNHAQCPNLTQNYSSFCPNYSVDYQI